jgi:DNA-binding HxlR family transcriptional regulator
MACSIARSLDVVGEPWTPLVVRDIWLGCHRFDEIQANLEISRKVLAQRLKTLVQEGVVERRAYQRDPVRYEYVLTRKGVELMNVLLALMDWGDRWISGEEGPPMVLRHKACGKRSKAKVTCSACGEPLSAHEVRIAPGPGARTGWGTPWEPTRSGRRP